MPRLPALAVVVCLLTAGCTGLSGGDLTFRAQPIGVDAGTVQQSVFELREDDTIGYNRTVETGGGTKTVRITTHILLFQAEYRSAPLGHLVIYSTPAAEAGGLPLNPLAAAERKKLVTEALSQADQQDPDTVRRTGNRTVTALGANRTLTVYTTESANRQNRVIVGRFQHGDDLIIIVGSYPAKIQNGTSDVVSVVRTLNHSTG